MLGSNDEVSGQRYLEASTEGDAIDCRDDRLVAHEVTGDAAEAHMFSEIRPLLSFGGCRGRRLEVVARGEDPKGLIRAPSKTIPTYANETVLYAPRSEGGKSPTELKEAARAVYQKVLMEPVVSAPNPQCS